MENIFSWVIFCDGEREDMIRDLGFRWSIKIFADLYQPKRWTHHLGLRTILQVSSVSNVNNRTVLVSTAVLALIVCIDNNFNFYVQLQSHQHQLSLLLLQGQRQRLLVFKKSTNNNISSKSSNNNNNNRVNNFNYSEEPS